MPKILGLDSGTVTGWAVADDTTPPYPDPLEYRSGSRAPNVKYGFWDFSEYKKRGQGYLVNTALLQAIQLICREEEITEIAYEEAIPVKKLKFAHAGRLMHQREGVILAATGAVNAKPFAMNIGTVKKYATKNGKAEKKDMIAAAKGIGHIIEDDNACDAFWILGLRLQHRDDFFRTEARQIAST